VSSNRVEKDREQVFHDGQGRWRVEIDGDCRETDVMCWRSN
jgi:hypothetical protein